MFDSSCSLSGQTFVNAMIDENGIANNFGYRVGSVLKLGRRVLECVFGPLPEYGRGKMYTAGVMHERVCYRSKPTKVLGGPYN